MAREKLFSVTKADCDIQVFRAGGKGGQGQNTTDSGVRIVHRASGAVGEARDSRSQHQNKQAAWQRMIRSGKFQVWLAARIMNEGRNIEAEVRRQMESRHLVVEGRTPDGGWEIIG